MTTLYLCTALAAITMTDDLPTVNVTADDTVIKQSCRIVIPKDAAIADQKDDGVIQIAASDITVEFAEGAVLRGAKRGTRPDEYKGYGICLNGHKNVTLRNARISGFWCGLWATKADGLVLDGIDASDNRRAFLRSTPIAEDGADWLFGHNNDNNEWRTQFGSAIYVEDSRGVTVKRCRVHDGQNGLCLDRVNESKIYDNDFSFDSGWGLALWRCNKNVISRNAIDFCVRGYSHMVYNRGQDSAGIFVFEQNCDNVFAENSATHGGDCFFGFAGREALGETKPPAGFDYKRKGNNNNLLIKNDFSYAPAHGIETTFSFGNRIIANRIIGNAICGVWGGFSQDTLIAGNDFEDNGGMGYGLERGGVNIEHGRDNRVVHNTFKGNKCGVHFWGGKTDFVTRPWGAANGADSTHNLIAQNTFDGDDVVLHLRGEGDATMSANKTTNVKKEPIVEKAHTLNNDPDAKVEPFKLPDYPVYGDTRPFGARKQLYGRENIIMTEWGPWDHASPLVRLIDERGGASIFDLHKMPAKPQVALRGEGVSGRLIEPKDASAPWRYELAAKGNGIHPYKFSITAGEFKKDLSGSMLAVSWKATFFPWDAAVDPRKDVDGWRKLAQGDKAITATADKLLFKFGFGGPSDTKLSQELKDAKMGGDHFGLIATTNLSLPKGKWKFVTTSDDGIRVMANGKPIVDNFTWHVPTRNEGVFESTSDDPVEITVEYFEIDGFATLEFDITPAS